MALSNGTVHAMIMDGDACLFNHDYFKFHYIIENSKKLLNKRVRDDKRVIHQKFGDTWLLHAWKGNKVQTFEITRKKDIAYLNSLLERKEIKNQSKNALKLVWEERLRAIARKCGIPRHNDLIKSNQQFLDQLKIDNEQYDELILCNGSSRQDKEYDNNNCLQWGTESWFAALVKIRDYLSNGGKAVQLNKLLLSDIYNNLDPGTCFDNALNTGYTGKHGKYKYFDKEKMTTLYLYMQVLAIAYPDKMVTCDFYEDCRGEGIDPDIIGELERFFTNHPEQIPKNVKLRLNHYKMGKLTPGEIIQGTGEINKNYIESIKQMIRITPKGDKAYGENDHYYHVAKHFSIYLENQQKQAWRDFNACLTQLNKAYTRLLGKKETATAAAQAKQLHDCLMNIAIAYQNDKDYCKFKQACKTILNDDNRYTALKEQMEWEAWKSNLILAVCTLGIGYAIIGTVNSLFTGQFHLFHSKFDQVKESAELIKATVNEPVITDQLIPT